MNDEQGLQAQVWKDGKVEKTSSWIHHGGQEIYAQWSTHCYSVIVNHPLLSSSSSSSSSCF